MARKLNSSTESIKHLMIDKANRRVVFTVSAAAFMVVFSLVSARALWSQAAYQNRVIGAKREAVNTLKEDLKVVQELKPAYDSFVGTTTNIIGGNSAGTGPQDGNNGKIVMDALPSKYNFPEFATNLEHLVIGTGAKLTGIQGTDEEVSQGSNTSSAEPKPVEMPIQITAQADYARSKDLVTGLERSIRPIQVKKLSITSAQGDLSTTIDAITYYQPGKSLQVKMETVK